MSTSSSAALRPAREQEIQSFLYPEVPPAEGSTAWLGAGLGTGSPAADTVARTREAGRQEGEAQARAAFEQKLAHERQQLAVAMAQFARDRGAYYQKVEAEVVQLALAIARKILHREAQIDPMLLAGIVRVALEKMEAATGVVLRVHPHHAAEWRQYLSLCLDPGDRPEIVEDVSLELDRCVVETSMGTTELGLEVQLKEIEQGLMDLLVQRPQAGK